MIPGDRLREARKTAGHRSARVAAYTLGITYSTYLGHENGQNGFTADQAEAYAKAFGVSSAWLLFGDSIPTSVVDRLVDLLTNKGVLSPDEAQMILGRDA